MISGGLQYHSARFRGPAVRRRQNDDGPQKTAGENGASDCAAMTLFIQAWRQSVLKRLTQMPQFQKSEEVIIVLAAGRGCLQWKLAKYFAAATLYDCILIPWSTIAMYRNICVGRTDLDTASRRTQRRSKLQQCFTQRDDRWSCQLCYEHVSTPALQYLLTN